MLCIPAFHIRCVSPLGLADLYPVPPCARHTSSCARRTWPVPRTNTGHEIPKVTRRGRACPALGAVPPKAGRPYGHGGQFSWAADVLRLSQKPQILRMDAIYANEIFLFSMANSLSPRRRPGSRIHFLDSGLRRNDTQLGLLGQPLLICPIIPDTTWPVRSQGAPPVVRCDKAGRDKPTRRFAMLRLGGVPVQYQRVSPRADSHRKLAHIDVRQPHPLEVR